MKTINLKLPRARWYDVSPPIAAAICIFALLAIAGLVGKIQSTPSMLLQPTPPLPVVIIASPLPQGPVPTAVPAVQGRSATTKRPTPRCGGL